MIRASGTRFDRFLEQHVVLFPWIARFAFSLHVTSFIPPHLRWHTLVSLLNACIDANLANWYLCTLASMESHCSSAALLVLEQAPERGWVASGITNGIAHVWTAGDALSDAFPAEEVCAALVFFQTRCACCWAWATLERPALSIRCS